MHQGDKIASSIVAQTAKVPTLPWSGSGLQLPEQYVREYELVTSVPDELYNKACVQGVERALQVRFMIYTTILLTCIKVNICFISKLFLNL